MHKILPYSPSDSGGINRTNLLRKIWTKPRATLSYILANHVDGHVTLFFALGGITRAVGRAITQYPTNKTGGATTLILAIIVGSISGMTTYTAYAWGMSFTGGWLGGKASSDEFKTVLGWASVPSIATLLFLIPILAVQSREVASTPAIANALAIGCAFLQIGLGTWSTVILLKGVALIQGFSVGRALANVLLPGILLIGLILLISRFW